MRINRIAGLRAMAACAMFGTTAPWLAWNDPLGAQQSPVITVQGLQRIKSDPNLVILHIGPKEDYDAGHIEGARFVTMQDLAVDDSVQKLSLEMPSEADLRARLQRLGIGNKSKVVVTFGADWGSPSTRTMWALQVAGVGPQSQLLDGGTVAWKRAGLPLTKAVPAPAVAGVLTVPAHRELTVDYAWMQSHVNSPGVKLIDGRAPVFFEGAGMKMDGRPPSPAGHIAGAKNIPFNSLVTDDVLLLPIDSLRKTFANAGVQPGDTVAAYCHIGQQGTTVLLVARLLGHPVRLYDGSMNDWNNRKLPMVNDRPGN
ncbi:MAG: rhodanese-like domain-containing protein [Gemmatimonadaceae bacterium]